MSGAENILNVLLLQNYFEKGHMVHAGLLCNRFETMLCECVLVKYILQNHKMGLLFYIV